LFANVVLSGGTTCFEGFSKRLLKELQGLVHTSTKLHITAPADRKYSVWAGGSVLAGLKTFSDHFVTASEWEEFGSSVIHRKLFA
jgi:actin